MMNMIRLFALLLLLSLPMLAAAQHSNTINIAWVPSGDPPLVFVMQRASVAGGPYTTICGGAGQPACPAGAAAATFIDATVKAGDVWFYVSRASGPGGLGPLSNEVKFQTPFLPATTAPSLSGSSQ